MSESSALSRVELLDSVGGCATLCTQVSTRATLEPQQSHIRATLDKATLCPQLGSDCEGFSSRFYGKDSVETFRGFKCEFSFSK